MLVGNGTVEIVVRRVVAKAFFSFKKKEEESKNLLRKYTASLLSLCHRHVSVLQHRCSAPPQTSIQGGCDFRSHLRLAVSRRCVQR